MINASKYHHTFRPVGASRKLPTLPNGKVHHMAVFVVL